MLEAGSDDAMNLLYRIFGEWLLPFMFVFILGAFNFMFVSAKGIQYLDKEFSPDKKYDDTWSIAASQRFFSYCWDYLRGKIKTERFGMRVWMWFNSISHVMAGIFLLYCILFDCYKWILEL